MIGGADVGELRLKRIEEKVQSLDFLLVIVIESLHINVFQFEDLLLNLLNFELLDMNYSVDCVIPLYELWTCRAAIA